MLLRVRKDTRFFLSTDADTQKGVGAEDEVVSCPSLSPWLYWSYIVAKIMYLLALHVSLIFLLLCIFMLNSGGCIMPFWNVSWMGMTRFNTWVVMEMAHFLYVNHWRNGTFHIWMNEWMNEILLSCHKATGQFWAIYEPKSKITLKFLGNGYCSTCI